MSSGIVSKNKLQTLLKPHEMQATASFLLKELKFRNALAAHFSAGFNNATGT